jgi:type I restriction-modification system DNA methylase subunit
MNMKVDEKIRKARRKKTAEVFTPKELVQEILDKLPEDSWEEDKTFCDPAAGNGNFLVEAYAYKVEKYNHDPIKALSTIYGVELMPDNTVEMKMRLYRMAKDYGVDSDKAKEIINKNIVCHDALTYDWSFS